MIAFDAAGNFYIADSGNHRVRRVRSTTGVITTVAGTGTRGFSGDGGLATAAEFAFPSGVALDAAGNLYISDRSNARVRKVDAATGIVTTIVGGGQSGFSGDGGPALGASLRSPNTIALDASGTLYIADASNHRIRVVVPSSRRRAAVR